VIEDGEADGIFPKEFFDNLLESCGLGVITLGDLVTLVHLSHASHNFRVNASVVIACKPTLISHETPFFGA